VRHQLCPVLSILKRQSSRPSKLRRRAQAERPRPRDAGKMRPGQGNGLWCHLQTCARGNTCRSRPPGLTRRQPGSPRLTDSPSMCPAPNTRDFGRRTIEHWRGLSGTDKTTRPPILYSPTLNSDIGSAKPVHTSNSAVPMSVRQFLAEYARAAYTLQWPARDR
jgi:hypothetical protein